MRETYKYTSLKIQGPPRSILKCIFIVGGLAIYGVLLIFTYESIKRVKYDSPLYNSSYVCHDSVTCRNKYNSSSTIGSDDNSNQTVANVAFFTSLYSDEYLKGTLLLGYTIKKHHPNHKMYLMYLREKVSSNTLCQVQAMGWIPKAIERIPPPWDGVPAGFIDQFSKLQIWSFVEFKDGIIYLDSDTIVLKRIDQLFELIKPSTGFEFAAAPDVWWGKDTNSFNAGFMLLKPSMDVYSEIMQAHKIPGGYDIGFAEQSFLNEFFRYRYLRLPETYNINLSMMDPNPHLWKMLLPDMNVVHYTIQKPFKNPNPGPYVEPYKLWNDLYKMMDDEMNLSKIESMCENQ